MTIKTITIGGTEHSIIASNVSGTVAVANGGTGVTTAAAALTSLGAMQMATVTLAPAYFSGYAEDDQRCFLGDVNGDGIIDNTDAQLVMKYYSGTETLSGLSLAAADVDGSGVVDYDDAVMILRQAELWIWDTVENAYYQEVTVSNIIAQDPCVAIPSCGNVVATKSVDDGVVRIYMDPLPLVKVDCVIIYAHVDDNRTASVYANRNVEVLYEAYGYTGNPGAVTLSESVANFSYIDIEFIQYMFTSSDAETIYNTLRVYNPDGKHVALSTTFADLGDVFITSKTVIIDDTTISPVGDDYDGVVYIYDNTVEEYQGSELWITKVVGYR